MFDLFGAQFENKDRQHERKGDAVFTSHAFASEDTNGAGISPSPTLRFLKTLKIAELFNGVGFSQEHYITWVPVYCDHGLPKKRTSGVSGNMNAVNRHFLAALLQFTVMPGLGVMVSTLLSLPEEVMIGMVLVGSCPGGTASNVIVYLARGNVALSVTMTMFSTMLAPLLTPGIIFLLLKRSIDLSFASLFLSVFQVVAVPLVAGLLARHFFSGPVTRYSKFFPGVSVLSITLIIACVMALNADKVIALPVAVAAAVVLHNLLGLAAGYGVARLLSCSRVDCRTVAVEIGMQNSGLGVTLANQFFQPLSALPGALFSLWHNLSGIVLAKYWGSRRASERK